jgi:glycosyltransferase involved in cell wall biosynthesis
VNKISVYILTYNEEKKIQEAIKSVSWVDEIIIIDSMSTDRTEEIASSMGAKVIKMPFYGFGKNRNKAIELCQHDWIFGLDADERCTEEVHQEIIQTINSPGAKKIYIIPRKNIFLGKVLKHVFPCPEYRHPQLFKKGTMKYTEDPVHEGYVLLGENEIGRLKNPNWHIPYLNYEELIRKSNHYSTLGARKLLSKGVKVGVLGAIWHSFWVFFKFYFLKLGFLDRWPGFVISLSTCFGTFYRYAKLIEIEKNHDAEKNQTTERVPTSDEI